MRTKIKICINKNKASVFIIKVFENGEQYTREVDLNLERFSNLKEIIEECKVLGKKTLKELEYDIKQMEVFENGLV